MINRNPTSRHSNYPSSILPVKCSEISSHMNLIHPPNTTRRLSVEPDLFTPSRIRTEIECDRQYSEKKLFGRFDNIMDNNSSSKFQSDPYFHNHPKSTRKSSSSFLTLPDYPSSTKAQSSSIVTFNQSNNSSKGIDNFFNPSITNSNSSLKKTGGISSLLTPLADDKFRFMEKQTSKNTKFESLFVNSTQSTPKGPANKLASAFPHSSLKTLVNSYQNSKSLSMSITQSLQQTQQKVSREPSPRTTTPLLCPQLNMFALKKQIEKLSSKTLTPSKNPLLKDNEQAQQLEQKQYDQPQELIGSQKQQLTQLDQKKQPFHARTQSACVNTGNNISCTTQSSTSSKNLNCQQQQVFSTGIQAADSQRKNKDTDNKNSSNSSTIEEVWERLKASRKNKSTLSLQDFTFLDQKSCRIEVSEQPPLQITDLENERKNVGEYDIRNNSERNSQKEQQIVFNRDKVIREQSESDISVNIENIMSKYQDTRESSDEMEEFNKIEVVKKIDFDENQEEIEKRIISNSKDFKQQSEDIKGDTNIINGNDENIRNNNNNNLGTDFSGIKISQEISSMQIKTLANLFLLCDTDALSEDYLRELSALKESIVSVLAKNS